MQSIEEKRLFLKRRPLGKSVAHAQIQLHLKKQIPALELEQQIGSRRTDGCWEKHRLVFEIQLSPLSYAEALQRCRDYQAAGYRVVWILHEQVFNRPTVSPAERLLRAFHPTYFTNGTQFYDQVEFLFGERRLYRGPPLSVDLTRPLVPTFQIPHRSWRFHFQNDLYSGTSQESLASLRRIASLHKPPRGWRWGLHFLGLRCLESVARQSRPTT